MPTNAPGVSSPATAAIARENPTAVGVAELIAASDAFAAALYPAESNHGSDLAKSKAVIAGEFRHLITINARCRRENPRG